MKKRISSSKLPPTLRKAINRLRLTTVRASASPDGTFVIRRGGGTVYGRCDDGAFTMTPNRVLHQVG
jgi:hypothetical protein